MPVVELPAQRGECGSPGDATAARTATKSAVAHREPLLRGATGQRSVAAGTDQFADGDTEPG